MEGQDCVVAPSRRVSTLARLVDSAESGLSVDNWHESLIFPARSKESIGQAQCFDEENICSIYVQDLFAPPEA